MDQIKKLSIVVSIYNEEENIAILYDDLYKKLNSIKDQINHELIFVNDGSKDKSLKALQNLQKRNDKIKIINFTRNFGHETAMTAGMECSNGDAVLFMDGDGQNPPEIAIKMIQKWQEGYDIVLSKRKNYNRGIFKDFLAKIFYKTLNFLSDVKFDPNYPDFRLISRKYIDRIKQIGESERMFRGILNWIGITNYTTLEFDVPERIYGQSKYNIFKYFNLGINGILQFSIKPLRIFTLFAILACAISLSYAFYVFVDHFVNDHPPSGFATIIIIMITLFSIQTLIISLIGEYIGRIHMEVKKRPLYFADIIEKK
jgi:glycosyltransferase involved in cell wall biosynthesis